jgi:hypothetical protein
MPKTSGLDHKKNGIKHIQKTHLWYAHEHMFTPFTPCTLASAFTLLSASAVNRAADSANAVASTLVLVYNAAG